MTRVLVGLIQDEVCIFFDQLLHAILYKFIEGVELLSDQPFLLKEARDDSPAVFLCYLLGILIKVKPSFVGGVFI